ncbi:MAG: hypothetical protein VW202_12205, partial [Halieaceae bacterium]
MLRKSRSPMKRVFASTIVPILAGTLGVSAVVQAGPAQWMPLVPPSDTKVFVYGFARTGVQKQNSDVAVV